MGTDTPLLSVRGLEKTYRKGLLGRKGHKAIDDVTLEVGRGTIFGLLGPNGAGKTTMIKVLLGLARGYRGEASLFGRPPGDPASRRRIGYLPEAHRLPGYLTGRQVLELFGMMTGRPLREVRERVNPMLERVGMLKNADRKIKEYSKGMQQRVGLAQALVHEPELIFLDEPTDGVDPVGRAAIRELVQELKAKGATIFINSHLLMEVELISDRIVIMNNGRIIREGTVDELTPRTGGVRVELVDRPEEDALQTTLAGVGSNLVVDGDRFELQVDDDELNAVIDRVRGAGLRIRSVVPRRLSLEESFIEEVQKEKAWK